MGAADERGPMGGARSISAQACDFPPAREYDEGGEWKGNSSRQEASNDAARK